MNINIPGVAFAKPPPSLSAVRHQPTIAKFAPESEYKQSPRGGGHAANTPRGGGHAGGGGGDMSSRGEVGGGDYRGEHSGGGRVDTTAATSHSSNSISNGDDGDDDDDIDDDLPVIERPIRVKSGGSAFDPALSGIDDDPNSFKAGVSHSIKVVEQFPPGHHPFEGVPHFNDLPAPEALASKSR